MKGHYFIRPVTCKNIIVKQQYLPNSNVLVTKSLCENAVVELIDYMHHPKKRVENYDFLSWIVRTVKMVQGQGEIDIECCPAFNYGLSDHETKIAKNNNLEFNDSNNVKIQFISDTLSMDLIYIFKNCEDQSTPLIKWDLINVEGIKGKGLKGKVELKEGQEIIFVFRETPKDPKFDPALSLSLMKELFCNTRQFWGDWLACCTYKGKWREIVERSAMTLKLLTFEPVIS